MIWFKRIFLFLIVNMLIMLTISIVISVLGIQPYITRSGLQYDSLFLFCFVWGMGGAFISLLLSKLMVKWMMGVSVIDPVNPGSYASLVESVHRMARLAGLHKMPEVGIYESPDLNAFATGPTKNSSLVAVSTGLWNRMSSQELEGVLAHEISHVANGDMVTMTLIQGIVNAFVMFFARIISFFVSNSLEERNRVMAQFAITFILEILFSFLGMIVVAKFSRWREFRADAGGAKLAGSGSMIAALEALRRNLNPDLLDREASPALASLKISGKTGGLMSLFSTHPPLEERISALRNLR